MFAIGLGSLFATWLATSLKLLYEEDEINFDKYALIAPTGGAIDISLSFKITIKGSFMEPALFIAS